MGHLEDKEKGVFIFERETLLVLMPFNTEMCVSWRMCEQRPTQMLTHCVFGERWWRWSCCCFVIVLSYTVGVETQFFTLCLHVM